MNKINFLYISLYMKGVTCVRYHLGRHHIVGRCYEHIRYNLERCNKCHMLPSGSVTCHQVSPLTALYLRCCSSEYLFTSFMSSCHVVTKSPWTAATCSTTLRRMDQKGPKDLPDAGGVWWEYTRARIKERDIKLCVCTQKYQEREFLHVDELTKMHVDKVEIKLMYVDVGDINTNVCICRRH